MTTCLSFVLAMSLLAAPPAERKQDALRTIEAFRGGRHWVDAKTPPPQSPDESLQKLKIEPGLKVELFAVEWIGQRVGFAFGQFRFGKHQNDEVRLSLWGRWPSVG